VCFSVLQCDAVGTQIAAVWCSVYSVVQLERIFVLQCDAVVLHCAALCSSVLQCAAVCYSVMELEHISD